MSDLQRARAAKDSFVRMYADHPYINGVGLTDGADGYEIKVNITNERAIIPRSCNGVPICVEFVGEVEAFGESA